MKSQKNGAEFSAKFYGYEKVHSIAIFLDGIFVVEFC